MKFYSYDDLKSRMELTNWIQLGLFARLAVLMGLARWFCYRNNRDSKYRERAIVGVICFLTIIGVRFQGAPITQASLSQYAGASRLKEIVTKVADETPAMTFLAEYSDDNMNGVGY